MQAVATRSELLACRSRTAFARQGQHLLTDKRAALVREFQQRSRDLLARVQAVRLESGAARTVLDTAVADRGDGEVASASFAAVRGVPVTISSRVVAGVLVADIRAGSVRRPPDARGYEQGLTPVRVDQVAYAYERLVERLLDVCTDELAVRRLAAEILRTTRQVNALEHVVIPQLQAESTRISLVLDEREREDVSRLRRARGRRDHRTTGGEATSEALPDGRTDIPGGHAA